MKTATAATSAADRQVADNRQQAGQRLRELAANLGVHRGFAEVIVSLEAGHGGTLGGVWGSSRALVAAAVARSCPGPLVVVAPHQAEIDAIARDLELFSDLPVSKFPAWEGEPGERVVYDEIYGERLRVLKALAEPVAPAREGEAPAEPSAGNGSAGASPSHGGAARIVVTSIQ